MRRAPAAALKTAHGYILAPRLGLLLRLVAATQPRSGAFREQFDLFPGLFPTNSLLPCAAL